MPCPSTRCRPLGSTCNGPGPEGVAVGVGSAVAVGVGSAVAVGVGSAVAVGVGSAVAVGVGSAVAVAVGSAVAVGPAVAVAVGSAVGDGSAPCNAGPPPGGGADRGASPGRACAASVRRTTAFDRAKPRLVAVTVSVVPTLPAARRAATLTADRRNRSGDVLREASLKLPRAIVRSGASAVGRAVSGSLALSCVCTRHRGRPCEQVTRARGIVNTSVLMTCAVAPRGVTNRAAGAAASDPKAAATATDSHPATAIQCHRIRVTRRASSVPYPTNVLRSDDFRRAFRS